MKQRKNDENEAHDIIWGNGDQWQSVSHPSQLIYK